MAEDKPKLDEKEVLKKRAGAMARMLRPGKTSPRGEPEVEEGEEIAPGEPGTAP